MIQIFDTVNWKTDSREIVSQLSRKSYQYFALMLVILFALTGAVVLSFSSSWYFLFRILLLVSFIAAGIYHERHVRNKMPELKTETFDGGLASTIILSLIILVGIIGIYAAVEWSEVYMGVACTAAFLLPSLLMAQWKEFSELPQERFEPWDLPVSRPDKKATISLNSLSINLKMAPTYFDINDIVVPMVHPGRAMLGKIFHEFIEKYNLMHDDELELEDEKKNPYQWEFFQTSLKGATVRYLDPGKSLIDNNVRDHSTITAKRVKR